MAGTSSEVVTGMSKKRNTKSSNNQPSSVIEVEAMDDMLILIFLQLPIISLILYKSVCKRWFNIITSPRFMKLRTKIQNIINPTSGLFLQRSTSSIAYDFLALDNRIKTHRNINNARFPFHSYYYGLCDIKILQSCNRLLLCFLNGYTFYVFNLFTNLFKKLPELKTSARLIGIKMVFDPSELPHYKVIFVGAIIRDVRVRIWTYSSESCDWSGTCSQLPLVSNFNGFRDGVYWDDAFYWLNMVDGLISKLDVVNLCLTSVPTPLDLRAGSSDFNYELFESRGSLLLACVCKEPNVFLRVYEMKKGYCDQWSLKYLINVNDILLFIPEYWEVDKSTRRICVRCIVLEEREEDSFMVMELYGNVVQYKMVLKAHNRLSDDLVGAFSDCIHVESPRYSCFPIIASWAQV